MKFIRNLIAAVFLCICIASPFVLWREFTNETQAGPVGFRLPSPAIISPTNISGLLLWLDSSQITGLADGDSVTNWLDLSGSANDASQGTASRRPTYQTNEANGNAVVRFDGVDDRMTGSLTALGAGNYTVFVVAKSTTSTGYLSVLSLGGTAVGSGLLLTQDGAANDGTWLIGRVSADFIDTTAPSITTNWHQFCVQRTGAGNADAFVNGSATTPANGNPGAQNITSGYTLADYTGGGQLWNGDIAEVIVYDNDIGTANRQRVEAYIRTKWGTP